MSPMHKTRGSKSFWLIVSKYKLVAVMLHLRNQSTKSAYGDGVGLCDWKRFSVKFCESIVDASMQPLPKNIFLKVSKKHIISPRIKFCVNKTIFCAPTRHFFIFFTHVTKKIHKKKLMR
jgi:hypothetical protein